jgi:NADP-dependent 3-hydroxy acid dehydrogenase YdfG
MSPMGAVSRPGAVGNQEDPTGEGGIMMRLKENVAIVTGGGGGLGEGIALCLAGEGADVVVSDIKLDLAEKAAAKVKDLGRKSLALETDVSKEDQVPRFWLNIIPCSRGPV